MSGSDPDDLRITDLSTIEAEKFNYRNTQFLAEFFDLDVPPVCLTSDGYSSGARAVRTSMKKVSVSLTAEHLERIEARADEGDTGRSAALRAILNEYEELQTEYEETRTEYEHRIEELETEVERLKREKRQILAEREEKQELARYVEDERTAAQRRREASVVARAKWWLFGQKNDDGPE